MAGYTFSGKNILITGATGGLGSALVRRLAESDAHLILSARSDTALAELVSYLPEGTRTSTFTADLSQPGEARRLAEEALKTAGSVDVLFNNAGIGYFALLAESTEENVRHLFEVNTFSPLQLIKSLVPRMKAAETGRIINIVSCAGRIPIPTVGVYGGSKSALAIMANTMRLELASEGIDIINVYPGTVDTSFEENALREEDRPGLCPTDTCGAPRFDIADQVLRAASGPPGEVWLEYRGKWLSTAALMWPKSVDSRLKAVRDGVLQKTHLKARRWRLLQVESSLACNLRCIMCPWEQAIKRAAAGGRMSGEIWEGIRPHLTEVESIDFTGGGEPLLQPRLMDWVVEAKAAGCRVGFTTNGLLLRADLSEELVQAGLDWVCFSLDAATPDVYHQIRRGSDFGKVCENISRLAAMRRGSGLKTMINYVLMPMNAQQVEDIISVAADLGVDQVNFKQCDVIRGEHGRDLGLFASRESKAIRRLEKGLSRAKRLARKLKVRTTAFSFTPNEQPVCDQDPRNSVFVRYDGAVAPCINLAIGGQTTFLGEPATMPTVHYGQLPADDLLGLWRTETCLAYRERFEDRMQAYDKAMLDRLIGAAGSSRERTLKAARDAMPSAIEGCNVCHYLYGI